MPIENTDILLVNKGDKSYKIEYDAIKTDIKDEVKGEITTIPEAPDDGTQYGRQKNGQDMEWTPIVHTPAYGDSDVDAHLNKTALTTAGNVLSWGGDQIGYEWIPNGSGSGSNATPNNIFYTYPTGQPDRKLQDRLEDYVSVRDFGAVGNGVADDTIAVQAALNSGNSIFFPLGIYKCNSTITVQGESLAIVGSGLNTVILYDGPNTTESFITLKYNSGATTSPLLGDSNGNSFTIRDIQILISPNKTAGCGLKLEYTNAPAIVGGYNKLNLNNVDIGSLNAAVSDAGSFTKGLWLLNSAGVIGSNVNIYNINKAKEDDSSTIGIHIENTKVNHNMIRTLQLSNFYVQYYHDCVKAEKSNSGTTNIETLYLTQGELLGTNGVVNNDVHAVAITNSHFSVKEYALDLATNGGPTRILGNDIRCNRGTGQTHLIRMASPNTTFVGNYVEALNSGQGAIVVGDSPVNFPPYSVVIANNSFKGPNGASGKHAVHVKTGCVDVVVSDNIVKDFYSEIPYLDDTRPREMSLIQRHTGGSATETYTNRSHAWGIDTVPNFPGYGNSSKGSRMEVTSDGNSLFMSRNSNFAANFNRNNDGAVVVFSRAGSNKGSIDVNGSNIKINGLAGGPLMAGAFNLDTSEGIIDALRYVMDRLQQLESN